MKILTTLAIFALIGLTACIESKTTTDSFSSEEESLPSNSGFGIRSIGRWTKMAHLKETKVTSDGRFMVFRSDDGGFFNLFAYDLESGTMRMLNRPHRAPGGLIYQNSKTMGVAAHFEIVPGEHRVIYVSDEEKEGRVLLYQVSLDGGEPTALSPSRAGDSDEPARYGVGHDLPDHFQMAPNGKFVLFEYYSKNRPLSESHLYIVDLETKTHFKINPEGTVPFNGHAISVNSNYVVYSAKEYSPQPGSITMPYRLFSYKIETGSTYDLVPPDMQNGFGSGYDCDKFLPNGESVLCRDGTYAALGQLFLVDLEGRERPQKMNHPLTPGGLVLVYDYHLSPDGKKILYAATDNLNLPVTDEDDDFSYYLVDVSAPGKATHIAKRYGPSRAERAIFSPTGQSIMYVTRETSNVYLSPNKVWLKYLMKIHIVDSSTGMPKARYLTSLTPDASETSAEFLGEDRILMTGQMAPGPYSTPMKQFWVGIFDVRQKKVIHKSSIDSKYTMSTYVVKDQLVLRVYDRGSQISDINNSLGDLKTFSLVDGSLQELVSHSHDLGAVLHADSVQDRLYFYAGTTDRLTLSVIESK